VVLARFTAWHVTGAVEAARQGLERARAELDGLVPPEAVEAAVVALEREQATLLATAREVRLVELALRGHRPRVLL
jgi:hypothetical protein